MNKPPSQIALEGEIDLQSSPQLAARLEPLIAAQPDCLEIDLSKVSYIDSSGLAVLITAFQRLRGHGGRIRLLGTPPAIRNILSIARLDQIFEIAP